MSGSPRRRKPSLSPTRVPTLINCEPTWHRRILTLSSLIPCVSLSELTEARFLLTPLNAPESRLFPDVPYDVKVQNGFALFQARYVTRHPLLALLRIPTKTCAAPHPRSSPPSSRHSHSTARRRSQWSATVSVRQSRSSTASTSMNNSARARACGWLLTACPGSGIWISRSGSTSTYTAR